MLSQPNGLGFATFAHFGEAEAVVFVDDALYTVGTAENQDPDQP